MRCYIVHVSVYNDIVNTQTSNSYVFKCLKDADAFVSEYKRINIARPSHRCSQPTELSGHIISDAQKIYLSFSKSLFVELKQLLRVKESDIFSLLI